MRYLLLSVIAAGLGACQAAPHEELALFNHGEVRVVEGEDELAAFEDDLIATLDGARERAWLVTENLQSMPVAEALLAARERGVDVRVVIDADHAGAAPMGVLAEGLKLRVEEPSRVGIVGDGLIYRPEPTRTISRDSEINRMTHNFLLVDSFRVLSWSLPLGDDVRRLWTFDITSTDVAKDFEDEANQLLGGVDASQLSFFDGPLKSNTNDRIYYPMDDGVWELYFGPQERLLKRVLDEVYAARASVQIVTSGLENDFLLDALRYKAQVGKQVQVTVDDAWLESAERARRRAGGVDALPRDSDRMASVRALRRAADLFEVRRSPAVGGTIVIVDALTAPDGRQYTTRTLALSHELAHSIPFDRNDVGLPSDAFMDGHMWIFTQRAGRPDSATASFARTAARIGEEGGPL